MLIFTALIYSVAVSFIANSYVLIQQSPQSLYALIPLFLFINLFAGCLTIKTRSKSLKICYHGTILLTSFCVCVIASIVFHVLLGIKTIPNDYMRLIGSLVLCVCVNFVVFWNGIICVYLTSTQLGIKIRIIGIICGMIPIVNLIALFFIIKTTATECLFEVRKERMNRQRYDRQICSTKYPLLLVHGVFFRDTKYFNYWGRIPKELEANGARIFYGNHHSASSVADSAAELRSRILEILSETKAEKVNIIAHSKGGLDCRYAISKLGISDKVASLTTVNTPHRGCLFADYLLNKIPSDTKDKVANAYNSTLKGFGEPNPDFLAAVNDLTDTRCNQLNGELATPEGVFCQSVGSVLTKAANGKFPLNFTYHLVKHFSGENDGLVDEASFRWGENYILIRPTQKRGISHGDMIDLNRQNINGFDVREFYVDLVSGLKSKGL